MADMGGAPLLGSIPVPQQRLLGAEDYSNQLCPNLFSDMDSPIAMKEISQPKLTRFQKSLGLLDHQPKEHGHGTVEWYYEQTDIADAVEALGWWNPVLSGRPKHFAQMLLNGVPAPVPGRGLTWKLAGLMYFTPMVTDRSKSRNRTTLTGLLLLKHWAEKFPRFAPFLAAYHSTKAEREIGLECVDLAMGNVPVSFKRMHERHKANTEIKHRLERARKAIEEQARAEAEYKRRMSMMAQQADASLYGFSGSQSRLLGVGAQQSRPWATDEQVMTPRQLQDIQQQLNGNRADDMHQRLMAMQAAALAVDVQKESRYQRILKSLPDAWKLLK